MFGEDRLTICYAIYKQKKMGGWLIPKELARETWRNFRETVNGKDLILYGSGELCEYFLNVYNEFTVKYIVDGKIREGQKKELYGIPVISPSELADASSSVILITPAGHIDEIYEASTSYGCNECFSLVAMEQKRFFVKSGVIRLLCSRYQKQRYRKIWRKRYRERQQLIRLNGLIAKQEQTICTLQKKTDVLQVELNKQKKRADGIQARQTERYRYLLHTNRVLNYMIEKLGYEELKEEQIKYKFTEIYKNAYEPDFENPKRFNEKIQAMLLKNPDNELFARVTDKYELKKYVTEIIGREWVVPTLALWNSLEEVDYTNLPKSFVLKATNGGDSERIIIIKDRYATDMNRITKQMKPWFRLGEGIYWGNFNSVFKNVKQRIIAEENVKKDGQPLYDVKYWMFHGEAKFYNIPQYYDENGEFTKNAKNSYYKMDGTLFPIKTKTFVANENEVLLPNELFKKMGDVAKILAKPFEFVRVDFLVSGDQVYVGELTLTPGAGFKPFDSEKLDRMVGDFW